MNLSHLSSMELSTHDLSLLIDGTGRLWRFHHADDGHVPVHPVLDAHLEGVNVVISVDAQVRPQDVQVRVRDHVMEISRDGDGAAKHLADVLLPEESVDERMILRSRSGGFDVTVPLSRINAAA